MPLCSMSSTSQAPSQLTGTLTATTWKNVVVQDSWELETNDAAYSTEGWSTNNWDWPAEECSPGPVAIYTGIVYFTATDAENHAASAYNTEVELEVYACVTT